MLALPKRIAAGLFLLSLCACPPVVPDPAVAPGDGGAADNIISVPPVPPPVVVPGLAPTPTNLVRLSPCDVLPEFNVPATVGTIAHPNGYPRRAGEAIIYNVGHPEPTPDPVVVEGVTQGSSYENEVHDCQRLVRIAGADSSFGPLVGILPLDSAMALEDTAFDDGVPVATVYNWGDFHGNALPYSPLSVGPGWNCLWLRRNSATSWSAAITPDAPDACFARTAPASGDYTLDVLRALHTDTIPRTARWGWDALTMVHHIGVKCGSAWCWVAPSFGLDWVELSGPPHTTIPGYFDEQHLAVPEGTDSITPGPYARVTPTDLFFAASLEQHRQPRIEIMRTFFQTDQPVAEIEIPGLSGATPAPYATRWGGTARPVTMTMGVNPVGNPIPRSSFIRPDGSIGRTVNPRVINGVLHAAVGAVRWRWHDTVGTESIWSACGVNGTDCCDTE